MLPTPTLPTIALLPDRQRRIRSGHPWAYSNEVAMTPAAKAFLPENPHVRFYNAQRGYVSCTVTPTRWQSDYRIVPFVRKPGAPIETAASFVVEHGKPGAQRA